MDINKTTHTGTAITNPTFQLLNNKTPMTIFTLKVRETWKDRSGIPRHRDNLFKIETLGKNAYWVKSNVQSGKRYYIDGYLRSDAVNEVEETKIRSFNVTPEDNIDFSEGKRSGYREGLIQAVAIIENSDSQDSARAKLELLRDQSL